MLTYITAIATAITLTITPVVVSKSARENTQENKVTWAKYGMASHAGIQIADVISLVSQRPGYFLSKAEQGALKRALLRSVKVIDPRFV